MRKVIFFALLGCFFLSCQKSLHWPAETSNNVIAVENERLSKVVTRQTLPTWLNGQVVDEQDKPVAGATVSCGNITTTTDNKGIFRFKDLLQVNKNYALINVVKPGFMTGYRTFAPNQQKIAFHHEKIMLQATPASMLVPSTGGTITTDNVKLSFPADAIVRPEGTPYTGNVHITARYLDPAAANFGLMMPGVLAGLNTAGQINAMQSFGMANVELKDDAGKKLEIAPGKKVTMEMPASAAAPVTIPLWHFNEDYGIWVQQGIATKKGNVYVAEVNHFSIWNLDLEFNDFVLNLRLQINDSTPLANQAVSVYGGDSGLVHVFYTDNSGEATLINCPSDMGLKLELNFPCDTVVYSLAALTQSRTDTININGPSVKTYQLSGTVINCDSQAIAKQPFEMLITGSNGSFLVLNGITDDEGKYSLSTVVPSCQTSSFEVQTTAYFNNKYYFSSMSPVVEGVNSYDPQLCDNTSTSVTLQPANNSTELNFAGYANGTDLSAHEKELCAGAWTNSGNEFYLRGAIKFDLSSIPANATIVSAKLTLYSIPDPQNGDQTNANSGTDNSMYIQRITQSWSAANATWGTQPPTSTTNQVSIAHTTQSFLDLVDVNITGLVRDMHTQGNYGIQMRLQNQVVYNIRQFASSVHVNAAKHPILVIAYQ